MADQEIPKAAGDKSQTDDAVSSCPAAEQASVNDSTLCCQRCQSVILLPGKAKLVEKEMFLPHMKKKSANQSHTDGEVLSRYWLVGDMFTFENIGFSNTVDSIKYLVCADCEIGPVGWHDVNDKTAFYVAVERAGNQS